MSDTPYNLGWAAGWAAHERATPAAAANHGSAKLAEQLREGWKRECDDTDKLLRMLGLTAEDYRSDGGTLLASKVYDALRRATPAPSPKDAKDAARYRWIRDGSEWEMFEDRWLTKHDIYGGGPNDMDAAIDEAVEAQQRGSKTCTKCAGSGQIKNDEFNPVQYSCDECDGEGRVALAPQEPT